MKAGEFDEKSAEGGVQRRSSDNPQAERINQIPRCINAEMRIDRLDIRNFRCFEHRTFEFDPRFTLLIGANATPYWFREVKKSGIPQNHEEG